MSNFVYKTNTLLSLARLPWHFWYSLNKDQDAKNNPGWSIMSYIIARALPLESFSLPAELYDNFKKTLEFTNQKNNICILLGKRIQILESILIKYSKDEKFAKTAMASSQELESLKNKLREIGIDDSSNKNDFSINDDLIQIKIILEDIKEKFSNRFDKIDWP